MALATCRTLLPSRSIDQHMRTSNRRRTASLSIRLNAGHWSRPSPTITARAAELGIERVLEKAPNEEDLLGFIASSLRQRELDYESRVRAPRPRERLEQNRVLERITANFT
jgi:hypothetical protein